MNRPSRPAVIAPLALLLTASNLAGDIVPLERESSVVMTMSSLDFTPGGTTTGGPITLSETGLESGDDILLNGLLYYGPDGFDRINNGTFNGVQDLTVAADLLSTDLTQSAEVSGDANPLINIENDACIWFTVDTDSTGAINFEFDGATNIGNDSVGLQLQRVDGENAVLDTLFQLSATGLDDEGSGSQAVAFVAGERYKLTTWGDARSLVSTGPTQSKMLATITLDPSNCSDADLAEPFGTLDLADITAFVAAFTTMDPAADLVADGIYDLADISMFVSAFNAGCP